MRPIKMFGLAALAAVAAMAFVGATSAAADSNTVLCLEHTAGLECPEGKARTHVHSVLAAGTVGKLLNSLLNVLCLNILSENNPLGLAVIGGQAIHTTTLSFTGCGSNSAHDNCTVTTEEVPLGYLLKTGLDQGNLFNLSGRIRLQCGSINCVYDIDESEFTVGGGHITADETRTTELGGKLLCPNEGKLDWLLAFLLPTYVLE